MTGALAEHSTAKNESHRSRKPKASTVPIDSDLCGEGNNGDGFSSVAFNMEEWRTGEGWRRRIRSD